MRHVIEGTNFSLEIIEGTLQNRANLTLIPKIPRCIAMPKQPGVALASYFAVTIIIGTTCNLLVCLVIMKRRVLHTATNALIASLALSDIGVSLTVVPLRLLEGKLN